MLHEPATNQVKDYGTDYKMRLGVKMFLFYALIYAGFVIINITSPTLMEKSVLFDLNLAVIYGFGLIISALILAVFYNHSCTKKEKLLRSQDENKTEL